MADVIEMDPFRCRMWGGHERLEGSIDAESCKAEIESFSTYGQRLPVLGRLLVGDSECDCELVYGARRLFVARHLKVPLSVEVRELNDHEALIALDIENRQRKELSPYERGRAYSTWIQSGIVASQDELARTLNISPSQVSRLIKLAGLPTEIVGAFRSPLEICESWGRTLTELWEDPRKKRMLSAAARALAHESRRPPADVFKRLVAAAGRPSALVAIQIQAHDDVIKDGQGRPLFRVRQHRADTALLLPTSTIRSDVLAEITHAVADILQRARAQPVESTRTKAAARTVESRGPVRRATEGY